MRLLPAISVLVLLVSVTSCTVQKRHYTRGVNVDWLYHKASPAAREIKPGKEIQQVRTIEEVPAGVPGFAEATDVPLSLAAARGPDSCDVIIMSNGDEIRARVIEISSAEIMYRRCDPAEDRVIRLSKSSVFMIRFANGTREVFTAERKTAPAKAVYKAPGRGPRTHPGSVIAILAMLLAFLVPFVTVVYAPAWVLLAIVLFGFLILVSFVSSLIAIESIMRKPEKWNGKALAITALAVTLLVFLSIVYSYIVR